MLTALTLVVGLVMIPGAAQAYTLTGCKWGSSTITWTNSAPAGTYSTSAVNAASSWASSSDINGMSATGGQLKVYNHNRGANGYAGWTDWGCAGNLLVGANVTLNPHYTDSYSQAKKQAVWVHEFGHGVGLNHSASSFAMMWSCPGCVYDNHFYNTPKSDDIAGANFLY